MVDGVSGPGESTGDLSLVPTREILDEVLRRFDDVVIGVSRSLNNTGSSQYGFEFKGNDHAILGMLVKTLIGMVRAEIRQMDDADEEQEGEE